MAKAIKNLDNINFILAGPLIDMWIFHYIQKFPNVKYKGLLQPIEALTLEVTSNVMIGLYNPEILWNNITLPNKLFEAMMCGIPIITNIAQDIINKTECGIIVEYDNIEQIKEAIITLRDNPQQCKRLGDNGRKAFLEKYNWGIMEQRLYKVYEKLLSNHSRSKKL